MGSAPIQQRFALLCHLSQLSCIYRLFLWNILHWSFAFMKAFSCNLESTMLSLLWQNYITSWILHVFQIIVYYLGKAKPLAMDKSNWKYCASNAYFPLFHQVVVLEFHNVITALWFNLDKNCSEMLLDMLFIVIWSICDVIDVIKLDCCYGMYQIKNRIEIVLENQL